MEVWNWGGGEYDAAEVKGVAEPSALAPTLPHTHHAGYEAPEGKCGRRQLVLPPHLLHAHMHAVALAAIRCVDECGQV